MALRNQIRAGHNLLAASNQTTWIRQGVEALGGAH